MCDTYFVSVQTAILYFFGSVLKIGPYVMQYKKNILTGGHGVVYVTPKEGGRTGETESKCAGACKKP